MPYRVGWYIFGACNAASPDGQVAFRRAAACGSILPYCLSKTSDSKTDLDHILSYASTYTSPDHSLQYFDHPTHRERLGLWK
jgi:hypothetical protein